MLSEARLGGDSFSFFSKPSIMFCLNHARKRLYKSAERGSISVGGFFYDFEADAFSFFKVYCFRFFRLLSISLDSSAAIYN